MSTRLPTKAGPSNSKLSTSKHSTTITKTAAGTLMPKLDKLKLPTLLSKPLTQSFSSTRPSPKLPVSCAAGFGWVRHESLGGMAGYRCKGGSHFISDKLLTEGSSKCYLQRYGATKSSPEIKWAGPYTIETLAQVFGMNVKEYKTHMAQMKAQNEARMKGSASRIDYAQNPVRGGSHDPRPEYTRPVPVSVSPPSHTIPGGNRYGQFGPGATYDEFGRSCESH